MNLRDMLIYNGIFGGSGETTTTSGGVTRVFLHNVGNWYENTPTFGDSYYRVSALTPTKQQLSGLVFIQVWNVDNENPTSFLNATITLFSNDDLLEEEGITVIVYRDNIFAAVVPEDTANAIDVLPGIYMEGKYLANYTANGFSKETSVMLVYGG